MCYHRCGKLHVMFAETQHSSLLCTTIIECRVPASPQTFAIDTPSPRQRPVVLATTWRSSTMADSDPQLSSQPSSDSSETSSSDERSISSFEVTKKGPKLLSSGPDRFLRQLDEIHRKLKADLDKENVAQKVYCPALADAKVAVGHIRGYLDSYVLTPSPAMMSPESTPKTVEVFATGELVENILRFLEPVDLLVAAQVNHVTSKAIANSQTLQEILHLQPSGKGHISTIFSREESPFDNFAIIFKEISLGVVDSEDMPPLLHLNGTVVDDDTQPEPQRAIKYAVVISTQYQRPYFHKPGPITRRMLICMFIRRVPGAPSFTVPPFVAKDTLTLGI